MESQLESQLPLHLPPKKPSQEESQEESQLVRSQLESQLLTQPSSQLIWWPKNMPSQAQLQPLSQDRSHPPLQAGSSCRRSRAPSAPPVIADSFDERDEVLLSEGSPQPWTVESVIAR